MRCIRLCRHELNNQTDHQGLKPPRDAFRPTPQLLETLHRLIVECATTLPPSPRPDNTLSYKIYKNRLGTDTDWRGVLWYLRN